MLADFVLAVALICAEENTTAVQEILTTKPISFKECDKRTLDPELRKKYWKEEVRNGCDQDLICVRVYWKGAAE